MDTTKENKSYTIDDIARELGVSKTTVSRAISGKGRISQATIQKVKDFISTHNYSPNVMARGLAQNKTYNIALLLPDDYCENEVAFFRECMNGICKMAGKNNYDVLISMVEGQLERMVINHKVDGIILSRSTVDTSNQKYLKEKKIPFVILGSSTEEGVVCIDNSNKEASAELVSLLIEKGMKKLVILGGNENYQVTKSRLEGFMEAHRKHNIDIDSSQVFVDIDGYVKASKAVEKALSMKADCIVTMDDYVCNLVLECLNEKKIRIPSDIKVASLYDSKLLACNNPPVTSLHFNTKVLGENACGKLLSMLGENMTDSLKKADYQVIFRDSTK